MSSQPIALAPPARAAPFAALSTWRGSGLFYAGLVAAFLTPALIWPVPRTTDLVMHWARLTVLAAGPDDPISSLYSVRFGLIPNLGIDALYLALAPVCDPQSVAQLAFVLSIALPAWGAWALHRALFAAPSPTIWLAPLLSYNLATTGGLVNYAFGMGLALLGLSLAVSGAPRVGEPSRARENGGDGRRFAFGLASINLMSAALFFCHLIALAAFVLLFALFRATPRAGETTFAGLRRLALTPVHVALGLALVALRQPTPAGYELDGSKMAMLLAPVASMTGADLFALFGLLAMGVAALTPGLTIARPARLALLGLGLAALAAPPAHGAANLIDARLTVLWAYLAVAAAAVERPAGLHRSLAFAALLLLGLRLDAVIPAWRDYGARVAEIREEMRALPRGARALVVTPFACRDADLALTSNLAAFAAIDRRAYVNTLFAQSGMQPLSPVDAALRDAPTIAMDERWLTPEGRAALGSARTGAPWARAFVDWRRHFDAVIAFHGKCPGELSLPGLSRVASSPLADVYLTSGSTSRGP